MIPYRRCTFNIFHRTYLYTFTTFNTDISIYGKLLVCNHLLIEISTNYIRIKAWCGSLIKFFNTCLPTGNDVDDMLQLGLSPQDFLLFLLLGVCVHKRQTNV